MSISARTGPFGRNARGEQVDAITLDNGLSVSEPMRVVKQ